MAFSSALPMAEHCTWLKWRASRLVPFCRRSRGALRSVRHYHTCGPQLHKKHHCSGPARPEHPLAATSRRSLQGLYRFLAITVLLDVKDIPQVGPLQRGRITPAITFLSPAITLLSPAITCYPPAITKAAAVPDHPGSGGSTSQPRGCNLCGHT